MPSVLSAAARDELVADLRAIVGDRCSTNPTQLDHHSHGESWHAHAEPDVVVFPTSTEQVARIVRVCNQLDVPFLAKPYTRAELIGKVDDAMRRRAADAAVERRHTPREPE